MSVLNGLEGSTKFGGQKMNETGEIMLAALEWVNLGLVELPSSARVLAELNSLAGGRRRA